MSFNRKKDQKVKMDYTYKEYPARYFIDRSKFLYKALVLIEPKSPDDETPKSFKIFRFYFGKYNKDNEKKFTRVIRRKTRNYIDKKLDKSKRYVFLNIGMSLGLLFGIVCIFIGIISIYLFTQQYIKTSLSGTESALFDLAKLSNIGSFFSGSIGLVLGLGSTMFIVGSFFGQRIEIRQQHDEIELIREEVNLTNDNLLIQRNDDRFFVLHNMLKEEIQKSFYTDGGDYDQFALALVGNLDTSNILTEKIKEEIENKLLPKKNRPSKLRNKDRERYLNSAIDMEMKSRLEKYRMINEELLEADRDKRFHFHKLYNILHQFINSIEDLEKKQFYIEITQSILPPVIENYLFIYYSEHDRQKRDKQSIKLKYNEIKNKEAHYEEMV